MESRPALNFAFTRMNYILLLAGIAVIIIGFALMSGGGSDDPNVFAGDYVLDEQSFMELAEGQFEVSEDVRQKLSPLRDQVFEEETAMLAAIEKAIGATAYESNRFKIRSAATIHADIFSPRRISLAPVVVLFGYGFIFFAIMYKRKEDRDSSNPTPDTPYAKS